MLTAQQIQDARNQLNLNAPGSAQPVKTNWSDPNAFSTEPKVQPTDNLSQTQPGGFGGPLLKGFGETPTPFQSNPATDSTIATAGKTIGNMPADTLNLGAGIANFLNPVKNVVDTVNNVSKTYQQLQDYSKQSGQSPLSILFKSLTSTPPTQNGKTSGLGTSAMETILPRFLQQIGKGDIEGATKTLVEHPATSIGPLLLAAKGISEVSGNGAQFDNAMNQISSKVTTPASNVAEGAKGVANQAMQGAKEAVGTAREGLGAKLQEGAKSEWAVPTTKAMPMYNKATEIYKNAQEKGHDIADTLVKNGVKLSENTESGRYSTSDTADKIREDAGKTSKELLRPALEAADKTTEKIPVNNITSEVVKDIKATKGETPGNIRAQVLQAQKEGEALAEKYPKGLSISQLHDEKIGYASNGGYKPMGTVADNNTGAMNRAFGRIMAKNVEKNAPEGVPVKEFNQELQKQFQAADYLDALNSKKIPQGIASKIARTGAKVAGFAAGEGIGGGILGGVGGYHIGGMVETMLEGLPTKVRDSLLGNLKQSNPEAFKAIQEYLAKQPTEPPTPTKGGIEPSNFKQGETPSTMTGNVKVDKGNLTAGNETAYPQFEGYKDISTKLLEDLKGKGAVSKQYIEQRLVSSDLNLKQVEKDMTRAVLDTIKGDKMPVGELASKIKAQLVPLERVGAGGERGVGGRYENITLPDELRGDVANYSEHIYESPIKTSAGDVHFDGQSNNYFGHTRVEDMGDVSKSKTSSGYRIDKTTNSTRRVIEVQSDLYQKGNLEREFSTQEYSKALKEAHDRGFVGTEADKLAKQWVSEAKNTSKLAQYNDPTAHFRMVREEVKQAAKDGKTKLQFPTGETAMKIEGLGSSEVRWTADNSSPLTPGELEKGLEIFESEPGMGAINEEDPWVVTDVLGDGKFKAVPSSRIDLVVNNDEKLYNLAKKKGLYDHSEGEGVLDTEKVMGDKEMMQAISDSSGTETFDISGKVDTNNPIYRFYEKDLGKYLKSKYGANMVTDDRGVSWWEVPVKKEQAKLPVEAFAGVPIIAGNKKNK